MRHLRTLLICGLVCWTSLTSDIGLSAAPPKASDKDSKEVTAEVPTIHYLTLALIRDPFVQTELKLTSEQIAAVQDGIAHVDGSYWRLRDTPVEQCATELNALHAELTETLQTKLTQAQQDRFDEIRLQSRSWRALISADVAEQLNLTSSQKTKLILALKESIKEHEAAAKKHSEPLLQEFARSKVRNKDVNRFTSILTPDQRLDYQRRLGSGFDFGKLTRVGCVAPELKQSDTWMNSDPLTLQQLRGKVVVVHFWAFGCINCIRNLPHYASWHDTFRDRGVTIIGVHTPETQQERSAENLKRNVVERKIDYPVVFDAASENWKAWGNSMWPSVYLIDKQGRVRNWWYGELTWNGATGEEIFRKQIEDLIAEK